MSNFTFLKTDWSELYETAREAEQNVNSAPRTSCFYARRSLERAVKWLYANDSCLKQPYADNLAALIHEPTFRKNLGPCLFPKILTIQKIGNLAVHSDKPISSSDSLHTLKELFHVLYWLALSYSPSAQAIGKPLFDISRIPQKDNAVADRNAEQLAKLQPNSRTRTSGWLPGKRNWPGRSKRSPLSRPGFRNIRNATTRPPTTMTIPRRKPGITSSTCC